MKLHYYVFQHNNNLIQIEAISIDDLIKKIMKFSGQHDENESIDDFLQRMQVKTKTISDTDIQMIRPHTDFNSKISFVKALLKYEIVVKSMLLFIPSSEKKLTIIFKHYSNYYGKYKTIEENKNIYGTAFLVGPKFKYSIVQDKNFIDFKKIKLYLINDIKKEHYIESSRILFKNK